MGDTQRVEHQEVVDDALVTDGRDRHSGLAERLERAETEIATSLTDLTGTLRIASFQTATLTLVPTALDVLRDQHPQLRFHVTQLEPEAALPGPRRGVPRQPHNAGPAELEQEDLLSDPLHLALPEPAESPDTDGPTAALHSLAHHPWVMEPEGTTARHWAMTLCRNAGFEPDVRFETTGLLVHLVEQRHAAAFLPDLVRSGQPPIVTLRQLPRGQRARRVFTVVRRGRAGHPDILACRNALHRAVTVRSSHA